MAMEVNREKTRGESRHRSFPTHSAVALILLGVLVCAMIVLFTVFGLTGASRSALLPEESSVPVSSPSPETASPSPAASQTPAPVETEAPTPDPTASPEPDFIKTAIVIDGNTTVVLASRQAAEELINTSISHFELLCPGTGMITQLENKLEYADADASAQTTPFDEALALMTGEDSPLRVRTSFARNDIETIPHYTTEKQSDEHYVGTRFVASYGRDGKKLQLREYTYLNGALESLTVAEERMLCEPADGLVLIGTRPIPASVVPPNDFGFSDCPKALAALAFRAPVDAPITKSFGFYDGVLSRGINYGAPDGGAVYASCSGTVVAVISRGDLGITVDVSHGSGFVTRYSLLSSSELSVGDSIEAGVKIGICGASGLNFEVIVSGVPRNPRFYLPR